MAIAGNKVKIEYLTDNQYACMLDADVLDSDTLYFVKQSKFGIEQHIRKYLDQSGVPTEFNIAASYELFGMTYEDGDELYYGDSGSN